MADFGGRYRQVRLLGTGGMGEVWLALDVELDERPVAVKRMHPQMLADAEDAARFQREMRLAARMQHPNIMTVFTTGTDNGVPFMVMEYLEGQDLGKAPRTGSVADVTRVGRDTCAALEYAHGMGVVHRDIKPGNLFLCATGQVKVTDFGIARAVSGTSLTATGTLVGTLPYMAPEQWLGEEAAYSNDIWAVGCVLYELLSGRPPRTCASPAEYVAAAARREPVPPLHRDADTPDWLADAVMAMLEPDPRRRPNAAECVRLLSGQSAQFTQTATVRRPAAVAAHLPTEPSRAPRSPASPAARGRSRRIALSVAAVAVLAAGGTAVALMLSTGKGPGQPRAPGAAGTGASRSSAAAAATGLSVAWSGPVGITDSGLNFDNQPPSSANADVLFNPAADALRSADATAMAAWPQARAPAAAQCKLWVTTHPSSGIGSVTAGMQICLQTVQGRFVLLHVQDTTPELDAQATVWQQQ